MRLDTGAASDSESHRRLALMRRIWRSTAARKFDEQTRLGGFATNLPTSRAAKEFWDCVSRYFV
jgi:hypothetical protein